MQEQVSERDQALLAGLLQGEVQTSQEERHAIMTDIVKKVYAFFYEREWANMDKHTDRREDTLTSVLAPLGTLSTVLALVWQFAGPQAAMWIVWLPPLVVISFISKWRGSQAKVGQSKIYLKRFERILPELGGFQKLQHYHDEAPPTYTQPRHVINLSTFFIMTLIPMILLLPYPIGGYLGAVYVILAIVSFVL